MKKLLTCAVLLAAIACMPAYGQDAATVLGRFYKLTGTDQTDLSKKNVKMDMKVKSMGMDMPVSIIVGVPDRMRIEMTAMGQKMVIVLNGDQGWMTVPGAGVQTLPQEQLAQMRKQNDVLSFMRWDNAYKDFRLLDPVTENGVTYDVVEGQPIAQGEMSGPITIRFNRATGLVDSFVVKVTMNGQPVEVETRLADYKKAGTLLYPSKIDASMGGNPVSSSVIESLVLDYPVLDAMFAEPQ